MHRQRLDRGTAHFRRGNGEDGPNAFAAAEDGVAHRFVDDGGRRGGVGKVRVEDAVDVDALLVEILHDSSSAASGSGSNGSTRGCPFASARISSIFFLPPLVL